MGALQNAVLAVSMLSIAVAICLLICPDNTLQKQVKFFISLLFVISLILPFKNITFPESLEDIQAEQAEQSALQAAENCVKQAVKHILLENQISCSEISVQLHINEQNCISISDVSVTCDNLQNAGKILRQILGEEVSIDVSQILE